MELLQIIIFTLKLFALTSTIIVLISYFIFKLKDRNRIKPYMKQTVPDLSKNFEVEQLAIKEEKINTRPNRFKILNEEPSIITNQKQNINKGNSIIYRKNNLIPSTNNLSNNFNIYDYYANSNFEPMHKIKL